MNEYDIKLGDYVETWDGDIEYVTAYCRSNMENRSKEYEIVYKITHSDSSRYVGAERRVMDNCIKRIGANDFSKKKSKFVPIDKLDTTWNTKSNIQNELIKYGYIKLNELIEHINAIQERLIEDDSTRTD